MPAERGGLLPRARCEWAPGCSTLTAFRKPSSQPNRRGAEDEVVVCLEGELAYQVGEKRGVLAPGAMVWFPRKVPHAVANLAGLPCRFLTVVTPSGIEGFFRAQRDYLSALGPDAPFDAAAFSNVPGSDLRPLVGPPLT